jgi:hypothetical protein
MISYWDLYRSMTLRGMRDGHIYHLLVRKMQQMRFRIIDRIQTSQDELVSFRNRQYNIKIRTPALMDNRNVAFVSVSTSQFVGLWFAVTCLEELDYLMNSYQLVGTNSSDVSENPSDEPEDVVGIDRPLYIDPAYIHAAVTGLMDFYQEYI